MKPAVAFFLGSLVPAVAVVSLGGTPRACFVAGCLTAVIPALLFARKLGGWLCRLADGIDAVRGVSVAKRAGKAGVHVRSRHAGEAPAPQKRRNPDWLLSYSAEVMEAAGKPAPLPPSMTKEEILAGVA